MTATARPRRSVLYMPGSNARALAKGRSLPCDGIILDLEDAVSPDEKETARQQILDALGEGGYGGRELLFRVNGLDTDWGRDDLAAAAKSGADGVLLPKVESAATVREAEALLVENGAPDSLGLWCMMETPRGILRAEEIAGASKRLVGLVLGTSDLAKDLRCAHTADRLPMLASLSMVLLAGRAEGLAVLDGVHLNLGDEEGFAASCRQGAELGFDGKTLIHPKQVAAANEAFAPSEKELERAQRIIAAHAEAEAAGKGVVVVDGRLVENLHVEEARRLLEMARLIEQMG